MTIRVQWKLCLSELFHDEVKHLIDQAPLIGTALRTVARIYEALRKCEDDVAGLSRAHFVHFHPDSYGRGFIDKTCSLFTEINTSNTLRAPAI